MDSKSSLVLRKRGKARLQGFKTGPQRTLEKLRPVGGKVMICIGHHSPTYAASFCQRNVRTGSFTADPLSGRSAFNGLSGKQRLVVTLDELENGLGEEPNDGCKQHHKRR